MPDPAWDQGGLPGITKNWELKAEEGLDVKPE